MNRSEKIEKAAQNLIEALKPEIDWESVPMGTVVTHNKFNCGYFVNNMDSKNIRILDKNDICIWIKENCTVEGGLIR